VPAEQPLRRNRDFLALWTGQAASALGTSISGLAYPLVILAVTGSPTLAGVGASVLAATAFVVRIPAGVVVDRVDRKRLMLACDAGRLVAVGSLALSAAAGRLVIGHILVVAVVEGTLGSLFAPAEAVAVRRVVEPSQVRDAVARNQARQQLAGLVGPSIGGALLGWGRALPFLADALSYAVSFAAVATVRTPLTPADPRPMRRPLREELLQGLAWLWTQRFLRFVVVWLSGAGVLFTSLGLVTLVLARDLGATAAEIGLMFTVTGSGGLLGAWPRRGCFGGSAQPWWFSATPGWRPLPPSCCCQRSPYGPSGSSGPSRSSPCLRSTPWCCHRSRHEHQMPCTAEP